VNIIAKHLQCACYKQ